jgi:hypothetical protein
MAAGSYFAFTKIWSVIHSYLGWKEIADLFMTVFQKSGGRPTSTGPTTTVPTPELIKAAGIGAATKRRYLSLDAISWLEKEKLIILKEALTQLHDYEKEALFTAIGLVETAEPDKAPATDTKSGAPGFTPPKTDRNESGNLRGREILKGILKLDSADEVVSLLRATDLLGKPAEPSAFSQLWEKFQAARKEAAGSVDTLVHESAIEYLLRGFSVEKDGRKRPVYAVLMEHSEVVELRRRIDAELDADERRKLHEDYQDWLQTHALAYVNDDAVRRTREREQSQDGRTSEERSRRKWRFIYIAGSIIIVASLVKAKFDADKSPGPIKSPIQQTTRTK